MSDSVYTLLKDMLDRWEEIVIQHGEPPERVRLSAVPDQEVVAALVAKFLIERYHLDRPEEDQSDDQHDAPDEG